MANSPIIYGPNGATSLVPGGVTLPGATSGTLQVQPAAVTTSYGLVMPSVQGTSNSVLRNDGTGALSWALGGTAIPSTVTRITTVGTSTYTPPTGVSYLMVEVLGGGASGDGSGIGRGMGVAGSLSSFGGTLVQATGGSPFNNTTNQPGLGGVGSVTTGAILVKNVIGGTGGGGYGSNSAAANLLVGASGGDSFLGGITGGTNTGQPGNAGSANSGSGGSGGGSSVSSNVASASAGSAGGYAQAIVSPVAGSYTVVVGAGGTSAAAGTNGFASGAGGSGIVIITEMYAPVVISTAAGGAIAPTVTKFLSGSGSYSPPSGVTAIQVELIGGGGGGVGSGSSAGTVGTAGGNTTFGTSLLVGNGGAQAVYGNAGGPFGGAASLGSGPMGVAITGGNGSSGSISVATGPGGFGAPTPFGGGGSGGDNGTQGAAGIGYGSGGGGGGGGTGIGGQPSGAAGGYVKAIIGSPVGPYAYSVALGGNGGGAGTSGHAGGAGAPGIIVITESYANGAVGTATSITGSITASQISTNVPTSNISGTTTNNNAATGLIGEYIFANSVGVTPAASGSYVNVTSINLTAGDWDVEGLLSFSPGSTTVSTGFQGGISLTSGTLDSLVSGSYVTYEGSSVSTSPFGLYNISTGNRRVSIASTTTVYLVGDVAYSVLGTATWSGSSIIRARRIR